MARRVDWKPAHALKIDEELAKNWFAIVEVAEQGRTRIRVAKRDVARFRGTQGERLDQLQLPLKEDPSKA